MSKELITYRELFILVVGMGSVHINNAETGEDVVINIFAGLILLGMMWGIKWVFMRIKWVSLKEQDE